MERGGVCFIIRNSLIPAISKVDHTSGRHVAVNLKTDSAPLTIVGVYAPHALHDNDHKRDFYDTLDVIISSTITNYIM